MTRQLLCPAGHPWRVGDGTSPAPDLPRCPVCGAPPGLGSEVGWEVKPLRLIVQLGVVSLPLLVFVLLVLLVAPERQTGRPWKVGGVALLLACYLAFDWLARRDGQRRLRDLARAHGMRYEEEVPAPRVRELPEWELKGRLARWDRALTGSFLGENVLACEVQLRGGKCPPRMTAVAFDDPIPGLPDFDLEPLGRPRPLSLSELVEALRSPHPPALAGEPLGEVYRLLGPDPARPEGWLPRASRDLLARHPGWVIQARRGRLLVCREYRVCPVEGLPTLLAVACHFRRLFLAGVAQAAPGRG